ncbi:serine/threonine protein kinase, CMGC family [Pseudocercospora fijiensis CIRAD86]|uniref:cyclin-dependent kinase n=1 Tax=Pseudocercospora fijiensis (strain CIRAD86) TaxID=383855 RepID=M2YTF0_PSEFD|nr:serine/threonine protein kinase, CMGC family [Pseudocercospora fijiensis CIRAD86]EME81035.1 serine/threonine protein kinase, CMGC family [Pseudocercospora fijiensis CIRAD86]
MAQDWRKAVSFSDRLSETTKMQVSAYISECSVQLLLAAAERGPAEDQHADEHISPNLPQTGARIGKYLNAQHFADGLFSELFRAIHPEPHPGSKTPKVVALKLTNPSMMTPPHDSHREARILAKAKSDHTIPLLETFYQAGGSFVLAFPYMPHDLNMLLHTKQLTSQSRRSILRDLFSALAHLHRLNIIHRDIKPSNILLAGIAGPAYLADFGIAWCADDPASEPSDQKMLDVGTTCYRPPELLFGYSSYDSVLDMWAAGCVAAQVVCLNRETLFDAGDLGSELALIKSMFQKLGTPDLTTWPEAERMPDWGKMNFTKYPAKTWEDILPDAEAEARNLVRHMVQYESAWRLTANEVCLQLTCLNHRMLTFARHSSIHI